MFQTLVAIAHVIIKLLNKPISYLSSINKNPR